MYGTYSYTGQQIQYVNGIESARAYQLPPNASVLLMDSNIARFYVKQTDASGFSTIKAYDFKEVEDKPQSEYITREEFESFKEALKPKKKGATNEPAIE